MKYTVTVKPNAKVSSVEQIAKTELRVSVKASAQDGKANAELVHIVARFLHVPQSTVTIKHGTSGRKKIIEII